MNICTSCSKDQSLKELIKLRGSIDSCFLCKQNTEHTLATSNALFIRMVASLIRYYFSEWKYHSKLGDRSIEWYLTDQNPIFNYPSNLSEEVKNDFIMSFYDEIFEDEKVHLITAYGRDIYNYIPYNAVSNGNQDLLTKISEELQKTNYFIVEPKYKHHFKNIKKIISSKVNKGSVFYRARIGATKSAYNYNFEENAKNYYFTPHQGKDIGAPPIAKACSGRVNRPGVSYLYLASDVDTAISEVRPHPSEMVSTGKFTAEKTLKIADLSTHRITEELMTDNGLEILAFIIGIEKCLSTATPPSNSTFYGIYSVCN